MRKRMIIRVVRVMIFLHGSTLFCRRSSLMSVLASQPRFLSSPKLYQVNLPSLWLPLRRRSLCMMCMDTGSYNQNREQKKANMEKVEGRDVVFRDKSMRNVITSTQSLSAKKVHALLTHRKKREKEREVVVEGPRIVFDLYRNLETRKYLRRVLMDIELFEKYAKVFHRIYEETPEDNTSKFIQSQIGFYPTHKEIFRVCCTDTVNHQGIVAICKMPDPVRPRFEAHASTTEDPSASPPASAHRMYLVCDAVQDPGNMGTLVRSAVACGVSAIYLLPKACDVWNPKAIRAAMGATFAVPIIQTESWNDCYSQLQLVGCTPSSIYAATMLDDSNDEKQFDFENLDQGSHDEQKDEPTSGPRPSKAYFDIDWTGSSSPSGTSATASALIIGSEGNGLTMPLRNAIQDQEVQTVYVPMMNRDSTVPASVVESLNAAVCGSIILFEYSRQKQQLQGKTLA